MSAASPTPPPAHDKRSLLAAFRLLFGASMLSILFGVATNKLTVMLAGAEGVALIGLYRNLSTFVQSLLYLGMTNVVVQRISTAKTDDEARVVIGGAVRLYLVQTAVILVGAVTLPRLLSRWLTGDDAHVPDFALALVMCVGVIGMQLAVDLLNGRALVADVTRVTMTTSALTTLTVYPLLRLGRIGLAMVIGLTCFWGMALGAVLITRRYRLRLGDLRLRPSAAQLRSLPISIAIAIRSIWCNGALLIVQAIVNRHYGTDELGLYNAAAMLEGTAVLVILSGLRSYYLPKLGAMADQDAKNRLVNDVLRLLLLLLFPALPALVLLAPPVLFVLFSRSFLVARDLVSVFAFGITAEIFLWCMGFFFVHKADYRLAMGVDSGWALLLVSLVAGCALLDLPLIAVAGAYAVSVACQAVAYVMLARRQYHARILEAGTIARGLFVTGWTALACATVHRGLVPQLLVGGATLVIVAATARRELARLGVMRPAT